MKSEYCICGHNKFFHSTESFSEWVRIGKNFSKKWDVVARIKFSPCHTQDCECLKFILRSGGETKKVET